MSDEDVAAGARFCSSCGSALSPTARRAQTPAPEIATPQAVPGAPVGLQYAGFPDRFVAWLIDVILLVVVNVVLLIALSQSFAAQGFTFLLDGAYLVVGNGTGATLGKYTVGLRCVDANGEVPGLGRGLLRWIVSIFSFYALLIGYFWVLWEPQKRTWHDMAAGTYVVRL